MEAAQATEKKTATKVEMTKGSTQDFDRIFWFYMKNNLKMAESEIVVFKEAKMPAKINGKAAVLARFFNSDIAKEKGLTIPNYVTLNKYPELIVYEGYFVHGRGGEIMIKKTESGGPSLLDEKIKKGEITDVGVVVPKTAGQLLSRGFGKFLMMGGFIIVLVAIFLIVIGISAAVRGC
jgi:hypothetical protein